VSRAKKRGEHRAFILLVDVENRRPVQLCEAPVDAARLALQLQADVLIRVHVGARGRRDLQERHLVALRRGVLEQALERTKALDESLRIIEAVHAHDELARMQRRFHRAHRLAPLPCFREFGDLVRIHADGIGRGAQRAVKRVNGERTVGRRVHRAVRLVDDVVAKRAQIGRRLEA